MDDFGGRAPTENRGTTTVAPGKAPSFAAIPKAIKAAQLANVRLSSGTESYECFTASDFAEIWRTDVAKKVAVQVVSIPEVRAAVRELATFPAADCQKLLAAWKWPARKTWGELGRITPEGQTDAGQCAEIASAEAVGAAIVRQFAEDQLQAEPPAH